MHHDMYFISNWYTEIINTYITLNIKDEKPEKFEFQTVLPFYMIDM